MLPVVLALKHHPDRQKLVPPELWKYFDEPVLISGWYPERDYWVLVAALVKTIRPSTVGGDVWRYFAKFSAQRDVGGQEGTLPNSDKQGGVGIYRSFVDGDMTDPENFFRRALRLWTQYHDTGRMEIAGGRPEMNAVLVRLTDFVIPIDGFVWLQSYYLEEFGQLVGFDVTGTVRHSTANKEPYCEWQYVLGRNPATEAYVRSLPTWTETLVR